MTCHDQLRIYNDETQWRQRPWYYTDKKDWPTALESCMKTFIAMEEYEKCIIVQELQKEVIRKNIRSINLEDYIDGRIIIKGCSDIPFPEFAMVELMQQLQPVAKSIMYGEACSAVPLYKKK